MNKNVVKISILGILLIVSSIIYLFKISMANLKIESLHSKLSDCRLIKAESVTLKQLDVDKELKIVSYIKANYKRIPCPTASLIAKNTVRFAKEFNLPIGIVVGVIEVESSFNPSQVSSAKARGLMQVRWSVWKEILVEKTDATNEFDLHEIDKGIEAGVIVLSYYIDINNGDMSKALYDYVGKSEGYATKVYKSMGRFMLND